MDNTVHSPGHTLQPTEPTHSLIHVICQSVSTREQTTDFTINSTYIQPCYYK